MLLVITTKIKEYIHISKLAFCAIRNMNKLTADAQANIQNVMEAPNFWTRNPPIKLPHPEPSPQYTPWSMPCMVARLSGGTTAHI